jgi:hypothetical protein
MGAGKKSYSGIYHIIARSINKQMIFEEEEYSRVLSTEKSDRLMG